jgi:Na+/proline symporter
VFAALKDSPFPIMNMVANLMHSVLAALGSGILFSYPQLATITGVQGVVIYAVTSAAPLMIFAYLGPIIRAKCPEGFVLTEWTRQRYGIIASLYLSFLTLVTMFLYMVAELSALQQIMNALTGLNGLPMVIVECAVTTIYTCEMINVNHSKIIMLIHQSLGRIQDLIHHR